MTEKVCYNEINSKELTEIRVFGARQRTSPIYFQKEEDLFMTENELNQKIDECNERIAESNSQILECRTLISEYKDMIADCDKRIEKYIATDESAIKRENLIKMAEEHRGAGIRFSKLLGIVEIIMLILAFTVASKISSSMQISTSVIQTLMLGLPLLIAIPIVSNFKQASSLNKEIEKISRGLHEFDVELDKLREERAGHCEWVALNEDSICELNEAIDSQKETIATLEFEKKYVKYSQNYALVFVGTKNTYSGKYQPIRNLIEIDGVDYGYSTIPFKAIYLNPGIHTIKITVQSSTGFYSTNVEQFDVSKESMWFEYEHEAANVFRIRKFNNAKAFFESTGFDEPTKFEV